MSTQSMKSKQSQSIDRRKYKKVDPLECQAKNTHGFVIKPWGNNPS